MTTQGLACPTAQHVVKVIPSMAAEAQGTAAAVTAGQPVTYVQAPQMMAA